MSSTNLSIAPENAPCGSVKETTTLRFSPTLALHTVTNEKESPFRCDHSVRISLENPPSQKTSRPYALPSAGVHESDKTRHNGNTSSVRRSSGFDTPPTSGLYEISQTSFSWDTSRSRGSPSRDRETPGACELAETPSAKDITIARISSRREAVLLPECQFTGRKRRLDAPNSPNAALISMDARTPSLSMDSAVSLSATTTCKKKRRGRGLVTSKQQQKVSEAVGIAARLGDLVRRGGLNYNLQTFQTWNDDLSLLKPERSELTLQDLGPQLRIYTESLLRTSITANIIHSWYIIAYEYQLSTQDRSAMVRRRQSEQKSSKRSRISGTIFAEATIQLARVIGVDAYKLIPALSGEWNNDLGVPKTSKLMRLIPQLALTFRNLTQVCTSAATGPWVS